jgi:hypothetical protein
MLLAHRRLRSLLVLGLKTKRAQSTVQRCVERAPAFGPLTALDRDRAKKPIIAGLFHVSGSSEQPERLSSDDLLS